MNINVFQYADHVKLIKIIAKMKNISLVCET